MFVHHQLRRVRLGPQNYFKPLEFITDRSKAVVLMWSLVAVLVSEFQ